MVEPISAAGFGLRVLDRLNPARLGPLRLRVTAQVSTHEDPGVQSIELRVTNDRRTSFFRAQVGEAEGLQEGLLSAPWNPQWQFNGPQPEKEIPKGHVELLYIVATQPGQDRTTPRFLEFPTDGRRYRTRVAGIPSDEVESAPPDDFIGKVVTLGIIVTNRRLERSRRYTLRFWLNHDLTLGHEFVRLRRWPRSPQR